MGHKDYNRHRVRLFLVCKDSVISSLGDGRDATVAGIGVKMRHSG